MSSPLLSVQNLSVHFPITQGILRQKQVGAIRAVDDLSFDIYPGETLGLVGESGSGKSTTGRALLQLQRPTAGHVLFQNQDLTQLDPPSLRQMRRQMQIIFQDPYAALNPRQTVSALIAEPLHIFQVGLRPQRQARVHDLLTLVGLDPSVSNRYPHEFSGGQRQRIVIARALALDPAFIVCDEPISALDVSIQAQIINLLADLQEQLGLTYLLIAHDLSIVRHICTRVAVMYLGRIVELASRDTLYRHPRHPYTQALLSAVPIPDPDLEASRQRILLSGDIPSPLHIPPGCHFQTRCPWVTPHCRQDPAPPLRDLGNGHHVACHLAEP